MKFSIASNTSSYVFEREKSHAHQIELISFGEYDHNAMCTLKSLKNKSNPSIQP